MAFTPETWLARYRAGECGDVWAEMLDAGEEVRSRLRSHADAVATETMRRVRSNVETVVARLKEARYEFAYPDIVHLAPRADHLAALDEIERRLGPIPLSLRAFYEVVGTVDLTQSWDQLVQWHDSRREDATELQILGEHDPLVVGPLDAERAEEMRGWFFLAPDEFHKANYSGGENYHVRIPDGRADFELLGANDPFGVGVTEFFVEYLRATFAGGGFRGRIESDEDHAWKTSPDLELTRQLAHGLLPI